jgi:hypothetical protein
MATGLTGLLRKDWSRNMFKGLLTAAMVVSLATGLAFGNPTAGATVTFNQTLVGVWADFNDTIPVTGWQADPAAFLAAGNPASYDYAFDVTVSTSGLAAGETFEALDFTLTPSSSAITLDGGYPNAWVFNNPQTVPGPKGNMLNLFKENDIVGNGPPRPGNAGYSNFIVQTAAVSQATLGQTLDVGRYYCQYDGTSPANMTVAPLLSDFPTAIPFATWVDNASGNSATYQNYMNEDLTAASNTIVFAPEPATMSLLALGGIGALLRRRNA